MPRPKMPINMVPDGPTPTPLDAKPKPERPLSSPAADEDLSGAGKITVQGNSYDCTEQHIKILDELGEGSYGYVKKVRLRANPQIEFAMKVIRSNIKSAERRALVREIVIIKRGLSCPNIVDYYGYNFCEGDVWIYMELMEISLFNLYRKISPDYFPEDILSQIAVSIFDGLKFLKVELNVMHRDVKPSNLLMGFDGSFKICDFGICNNLEKSLLQSTVGCSPYLSPERIDPSTEEPYGVEADVWSYGLTLVELGKLKYPYESVESDKNIFSLLEAIVHGEPPELPDRYSEGFRKFVNKCLIKDAKNRPSYEKGPSHDRTGPSLKDDTFYLQRKNELANTEVARRAVRTWYSAYDRVRSRPQQPPPPPMFGRQET
eukprot:m.336588 g.336588  ORF g.336588 m.336588 type:complete len:375 (-) comp17901_c0_seq1:140-1264(-)